MRNGVNVLTDKWDVCIILDACRADILRSFFENEWDPPANGEFRTVFSLDSATEPWVKKTFDRSDVANLPPITYVSANPHSVNALGTPAMEHLDKVWRYGWDESLGTVPPRVVTDRTIHHYRESGRRVMAHYIQPHVPLLTRENGQLERQFDSKEYVFDRLQHRDIAHQTVWVAYEETLRIVLEEVTLLLEAIEADDVIITADHGNAFGEWGLFGHPYHMPFAVLREVPYVVTSAWVERDYEPLEYESSDTASTIESPEAFQEQLKALGYVE